MAAFWYNQGLQTTIDWTNDTLKTALVQDGSTMDADHDNLSEVFAGSGSGAADECDATNYARQTLSGKSETVDDVGDTVDVDADDTTYTSLGGASNNTIMGEVIYKEVDGTDANDIPVIFVEFSATEATDGNNFTVQYADPLADISNA